MNPAVVMPLVSDPDWSLFAEIPLEVPMIVVDDSRSGLGAIPRPNVTVVPSEERYAWRSSASRNAGHLAAYRLGYDPIIAIDYDVRPGRGWLDAHLDAFEAQDRVTIGGDWVNPIHSGPFARGFPYEERVRPWQVLTTVERSPSALNLGLWRGVLDVNGIDRLAGPVLEEPGHYSEVNWAIRPESMLPICGMNVAFRRELAPAYFFLPDVGVGGMTMSRHDDIWAGYVLKRLMAVGGDLVSYGHPVVDHTRLSDPVHSAVVEHPMHLLAAHFYAAVDSAVEAAVERSDYATMYAAFADFFPNAVEMLVPSRPYRAALLELGRSMREWSRAFQSVAA